MAIDWSRFIEIVSAGRRFLLTSHMRADCDAVGSELGMAAILASLGQEVVIVHGAAVCRDRHRHGLVPFSVGHRQDVRRGWAIGRRRRSAKRGLFKTL